MKETIILLYGSTGDLTFRKILPSLIYLKDQQLISKNTKVVALGRRDFTDQDYYEFINSKNSDINIKDLKDFVSYLKMEITIENDYKILKQYLLENSNENTKVIHYLAIASNLMEDAILALYNLEIASFKKPNHVLAFEKPFGQNYQQAKYLNEFLKTYFKEDQIYRSDHYLGKPLVNILLKYRYQYLALNKLLNHENIEKVEIILKESESILARGPYYDNTGAVSDMFQSHILQMVALVAMNKPRKLNSKAIIKEKLNALKKIKINKDTMVFGQYLGYLKENSIALDSKTETLFACQINVSNRKYPINVLTGKKLDEKRSVIKYYLKDGSIVNINIYPNTNIEMNNIDLAGNLNCQEKFNDMPDYAKLIISTISGKREIFVSEKEVLLMHQITDYIKDLKGELLIYQNNFDALEILKF